MKDLVFKYLERVELDETDCHFDPKTQKFVIPAPAKLDEYALRLRESKLRTVNAAFEPYFKDLRHQMSGKPEFWETLFKNGKMRRDNFRFYVNHLRSPVAQ